MVAELLSLLWMYFFMIVFNLEYVREHLRRDFSVSRFKILENNKYRFLCILSIRIKRFQIVESIRDTYETFTKFLKPFGAFLEVFRCSYEDWKSVSMKIKTTVVAATESKSQLNIVWYNLEIHSLVLRRRMETLVHSKLK